MHHQTHSCIFPLGGFVLLFHIAYIHLIGLVNNLALQECLLSWLNIYSRCQKFHLKKSDQFVCLIVKYNYEYKVDHKL